jgi:hypothetical protein
VGSEIEVADYLLLANLANDAVVRLVYAYAREHPEKAASPVLAAVQVALYKNVLTNAIRFLQSGQATSISEALDMALRSVSIEDVKETIKRVCRGDEVCVKKAAEIAEYIMGHYVYAPTLA